MMRGSVRPGGLAVLLLPLAACGWGSPRAVTVADSAGVRITVSPDRDRAFATLSPTPLLELGSRDGGPTQFSGLRRVLLGPEGDVWVGDAGSSEIRVFRLDGSLRTSVGRPGDGPGEFRRLRLLGRFRGDSVAVWDDVDARLTVLTPGGEVARVVPFVSGDDAPPHALGVFPDGTLLAQTPRILAARSLRSGQLLADTARIVRLDPDSGSATPLGRVPGPTWIWTGHAMVPMGFTINADFAVAGDDVMAVAGPAFRVRVLRDGALVASFGVARKPRPVTDADRKAYRDFAAGFLPDSIQRREYLAALDRTGTPDRLPAYDRVLVADDGNVWAEVYAPDPAGARTWEVYAPKGAALGSVAVPAGFVLTDVAEGKVAGVWRDRLGVEDVRVYGLDPAGVSGGG